MKYFFKSIVHFKNCFFFMIEVKCLLVHFGTYFYLFFCRYVYTQNVHLHIYVFNLLDSPSLCFPILAFQIMYMNF